MANVAQERDSGSMMISTIVAAATHVIVPLFWLFCSTLIVPRYVAMADLTMEDLHKVMPLLVSFSAFITKHYVVYLLAVVLFMVVDCKVHYSLLCNSSEKSARLWSLAVVIIQVVVSLLLLLPLKSAIATMDA